MENPQLEFPSLKDFPKAEEVTFRFYRGRLFMHQNDFKKAEEYLQFAFHRCHRQSKKNARLILIYLVVLRLLHGKSPKNSLLTSFGLSNLFQGICDAIKNGFCHINSQEI